MGTLFSKVVANCKVATTNNKVPDKWYAKIIKIMNNPRTQILRFFVAVSGEEFIFPRSLGIVRENHTQRHGITPFLRTGRLFCPALRPLSGLSGGDPNRPTIG